MIKIEKNVPIPDRGRRFGTKYPFREMVVGDSFFVKTDNIKSVRSSINTSARSAAKKIEGLKISTRAMDGGVRCWRVE